MDKIEDMVFLVPQEEADYLVNNYYKDFDWDEESSNIWRMILCVIRGIDLCFLSCINSNNFNAEIHSFLDKTYTKDGNRTMTLLRFMLLDLDIILNSSLKNGFDMIAKNINITIITLKKIII